jgi:serine/threonine protein kinase
VSPQKLLQAFGKPNDSTISELYYEWSVALIPGDDSVCGRLSEGGSDAEIDIDMTYKFSIMGFGSDAENLSSFCGLCLFRLLSDQPEKLKQLPPIEEMGNDETPVFWYLRHHAAHTDAILTYIEEKIPGFKFLCCSLDGIGVDGPLDEDLLDEDDTELHSVIQSFYRHPSNADALESGSGSSTGTFVGVDLEALSHYALLLVDEDTPIEVSIPMDIFNYVKPLRDRIQLCMGNDSLPFIRSYYSLVLNDASVKSKLRSPGGHRRDSEDFSELNSIFENSSVKVVDLGNACWTHRHFTDDIQTRQYRSPEVILGAKYDTSADMWSLACIIFELLTGDLLFDPQSGSHWDRDEDHLAMIAELMGDFPRKVSQTGKRSSQYFTKRGDFRHIHTLKYWPLRTVLRDKYQFSDEDSRNIAEFLEPLLAVRT